MDSELFYGRRNHAEPAVSLGGNVSEDEGLSDEDEHTSTQPIEKQRREPRIFESSDEHSEERENEDDVLAEFNIVLDTPARLPTPRTTRSLAQTPTPEPEPQTTCPRPQQPKKTTVRWRNGTLTSTEEETSFSGSSQLPSWISEMSTPYQFFNYLFGKDLIQKITDETNLYAFQQRPERTWSVSSEKIEQFLGSILFMSLTYKSSTRSCWKINHPVREVSKVMGVNRWEEIKKNLHFNNNDTFVATGQASHDKLHKFRPLIDHFRRIYATVPKEKDLCVDEQIIPFKGRSTMKQYNPKKPHKWGYKVFILSGIFGFSYDFEIFTGSSDNKIRRGEPDLGASSNVVIRMARSIPRGCNYILCYDIWFTSIDLQVYLKKEGILSLGTVRQNRLKCCSLSPEKDLKKDGRGTYAEKVGIVDGVHPSATVRLDNKAVTLLSTYVGSQPTTEVERYFRTEKRSKMITCPRIVQEYNRTMGNVDKLDSIRGLYRILIRSKKWYLRIFFHLLDLSVVNACFLWRRANPEKYLPLADFKSEIAECLTRAGKSTAKKRGRPSLEVERQIEDKKRRGPAAVLPNVEIRLDQIGHILEWMPERQRCKNPVFTLKTFVSCEKCRVPLCFNKDRNCYRVFHTTS